MPRLLPTKRTVLVLTILLFAVAGFVVVWTANEWPPPRLVLTYGAPTEDDPVIRVVGGIEFEEWSSGYRRVGDHRGCVPGDFIGRISSRFGLPLGQVPVHSGPQCPPRWVVSPRRFLIAREPISAGRYWRLLTPNSKLRHRLRGSKVCFRRQAEAFCARLCEETGRTVRLPALSELVFAGYGRSRRVPPWHVAWSERYASQWYEEMAADGTSGRTLLFRPVIEDSPE